jgi:ketosteroid isomerase-like protein
MGVHVASEKEWIACACNSQYWSASLRARPAKEDDVSLTTDDRLAILEVIARYNRLADDRDVEGTVALYTDDGYIDGDFSTGRGPDGLRADLPGIFAMEGTLKRHISVNHVLDGDGETATVRSLLLVVEGETLPAVGATADITDELRKQDGGWRVARHHVAIDPAMRNALASS